MNPLKIKIMLYIKSFANHEEFSNLFGITEHGNGAKSRKNRILLSLYKDKEIWELARKKGNYYPFTISSMPALKNWLMDQLCDTSRGEYAVNVLGRVFHSDTYETDSLGGICADGDLRCIRYIKHEETGSRIYKMKAGKFLTKLIEENTRCRINETIRIWLCEEFAADWQAYTRQERDEYTLHYGSELSDFDGIYGDFPYKGDFGSCMMGENYAEFYYMAVDATAAWLEDCDGDMVARCVIYNRVRDESGKVWRLAERQYSSDCDEALKRLLVLKLIDEGLIDGYKTVGASCHDSRNFVTNDGESLRDKFFRISCDLDSDSVVSYQDSFKYWNDGVADNYSCSGVELTVTDGVFPGREWDEWHERWCMETRTVYSGGNCFSCDANDLESFCWCDYLDEYHHEDDVFYDDNRDDYVLYEDSVECIDGERHHASDCERLYDGTWCLSREAIYIDGDYYHEDDEAVGYCYECREYFLKENGYFSELTLQTYCCEDCMLRAEKAYRESHALALVG